MSPPQLIYSSPHAWFHLQRGETRPATGAAAPSHISATCITVTALLLPFQRINTLSAATPSHSIARCRCVKQRRRCRALQENSNSSPRPALTNHHGNCNEGESDMEVMCQSKRWALRTASPPNHYCTLKYTVKGETGAQVIIPARPPQPGGKIGVMWSTCRIPTGKVRCLSSPAASLNHMDVCMSFRLGSKMVAHLVFHLGVGTWRHVLSALTWTYSVTGCCSLMLHCVFMWYLECCFHSCVVFNKHIYFIS